MPNIYNSSGMNNVQPFHILKNCIYKFMSKKRESILRRGTLSKKLK